MGKAGTMGVLTMDKTDIFIKTAKGEQEIATRVNKLPIKHRSVLIMIDGTASEESLLAKIAGMLDGKALVSELEAQGFIERKAAPKPAVQTHAPAQDTRKHSMLENLIDKVKDISEGYEKK
jgi:hypothetical protein